MQPEIREFPFFIQKAIWNIADKMELISFHRSSARNDKNGEAFSLLPILNFPVGQISLEIHP